MPAEPTPADTSTAEPSSADITITEPYACFLTLTFKTAKACPVQNGYTCWNNKCVQGGGKMSLQDCDRTCNPSNRFGACVNNSCVLDHAGSLGQATCEASCGPPTAKNWRCSNNTCVSSVHLWTIKVCGLHGHLWTIKVCVARNDAHCRKRRPYPDSLICSRRDGTKTPTGTF